MSVRLLTQAEQYPWRCAGKSINLDALQKEFTDWWEAKNGKIPDPNGFWGGPGGSYHPLTSWTNIEDFLADRHPASYTGSQYGNEEAGEALGLGDPDEQIVPPAGDETTAGMLLLHNQMQGLDIVDLAKQMKDIGLLNRIFQKREQMQRNYERGRL